MLLSTLAAQAAPHILMVVIAGAGANTPTVGFYPDAEACETARARIAASFAAMTRTGSDAYVWCMPDPVPGRSILETRP